MRKRISSSRFSHNSISAGLFFLLVISVILVIAFRVATCHAGGRLTNPGTFDGGRPASEGYVVSADNRVAAGGGWNKSLLRPVQGLLLDTYFTTQK
jgi:hypothetical protein